MNTLTSEVVSTSDCWRRDFAMGNEDFRSVHNLLRIIYVSVIFLDRNWHLDTPHRQSTDSKYQIEVILLEKVRKTKWEECHLLGEKFRRQINITFAHRKNQYVTGSAGLPAGIFARQPTWRFRLLGYSTQLQGGQQQVKVELLLFYCYALDIPHLRK